MNANSLAWSVLLTILLIVNLKDIVKVIRSAGETLEELSKEAPSEDHINSTATTFLKSLEVDIFSLEL